MADILTHQLGADSIFKFQCDMCGKCCIHREDLLLSPRDIFNMSKALKLKPEDAVEQFCEVYVGDDSRMPLIRMRPHGSVKRCPMLKDRKCRIHAAKPDICKLFPLGRGCLVKKDTKKLTPDDLVFFFTNPDCGSGGKEYTVREWLEEFGMNVQDNYPVLWHQTAMELATVFREMESKTELQVMRLLWSTTIVGLYFDYDLGQDFMPQFERNSQKFIEAVNGILKKASNN